MRPVHARRLALILPLLLTLLLGAGLAQGWGGGLAAAPAPRTNAQGSAAPLGGALAWGRDINGQLGDGTEGSPNDVPTPQAVLIPPTTTLTAVAAGSQHSLALQSDGTLLAWGANQFGQLGNGTLGAATGTATPQAVLLPAGARVIAIAAGGGYSLALLADGTILAWGDDGDGQLGDGTVGGPDTCLGDPDCHATPHAVLLPSGARATAVAAGDSYSLALLVDGTILAWGDDGQGQLGDGTVGGPDTCGGNPDCHATPHAVSLPSGARATGIAVGGGQSLALLADGTVLAWGSDGFGMLGNGTIGGEPGCSGNCNPTPQAVLSAPATPLTGVSAIDAGETYNLALKADGTVIAWGRDVFGSLGDGTVGSPEFVPTPQAVLLPVGARATAVAAGNTHSLALLADGSILAWGRDNAGQVGDGTLGGPDSCSGSDCHATPQAVLLPTGARATAIAAGNAHTLALVQASQVGAWGADTYGQVGDGTAGSPDKVPTPQAVSGLSNIVAIATGGNHSLALTADGAVFAWGIDQNGQLGDGAANGEPGCSGGCNPTAQPVALPTGARVVAIAAGGGQSLALLADGTVLAWGLDFSGQLGDGAPEPSGCGCHATPQLVLIAPGTPLTSVVAIAAGGSHSLALLADGTLRAWGDDIVGQLGDGTPQPLGGCSCHATPQLVPLPAGKQVIAIAAGGLHSLALLADSTIFAWGRDNEGQLGDGVRMTSPPCRCHATPQPVLAAPATPLTGVVAIAAGGFFSEAVMADGTARGWGDNRAGQLGDGTAGTPDFAAFPQAVALPAGAKVVALATGAFHTLAVMGDGTLLAWGGDSEGELGDGTPQTADCRCHAAPQAPILPTGIHVAAVAAGGNTSLVLAQAPAPTTTVGDSASASYGAASVALSATVTSGAGTVNNGSVTFVVKNASSATIGSPVSGAVSASGIANATFSIPGGTPVGSYTIEAAYGGTLAFGPSGDATPATLTISKAATSTTIGTPSTLPSCGSSSMTIPVTVANTSNGAALTGGSVTVTLTQGATVVGSGSAAVSGATPVTVNVVVALSGLGAGIVAVNASYSGNGNFQGSAAAPTSFASPLTATTVTVQNATATYGDASVTLTASVASANGAALTGGTVTFVVRKGTQVVATLTSGPVAGASPQTVSVTLPLGASYDARSYSITATYSGTACLATDDGTGTLTVARKVLVLKASDRTVGLQQPNPPTTPPTGCVQQATPTAACWLQLSNGSGFVYGQSWAALNFTNLRFQYNRNPPSTNATEHIGSTYRITALGVTSSNYEIRYELGTLTVGQ